jgi:6-phosphogluconolactonase (cycloisomerase 2 family)
MAANKNPLWLIIILSFLIVYCGVHFNFTTEEWAKIFEKEVSGTNYLYAATTGGIHAFSINSQTGTLQELAGSPYFSTLIFDKIGAYREDGNILLASKNGTGSICFTINSDGTLSNGVSNSFASMSFITVNSQNNLVYTGVQGTSTVSAYSIDQNTNMLTPVSGSPFAGGCSPRSGVLTPDNCWLYTGSEVLSSIYIASLNQANGGLAPLGAPATVHNAHYLAVHPSGNYLYSASANVSEKNICYYYINTDGSITNATPAYYQLAFGAANYSSQGIALAPDGNRLFATCVELDQISSFTILSSGALDDAAEAMFGTQNSPHAPVVDQFGQYLYAAADNSTGSGIIQIYLISNGSLQEITPAHIINSAFIHEMVIVSKPKD